MTTQLFNDVEYENWNNIYNKIDLLDSKQKFLRKFRLFALTPEMYNQTFQEYLELLLKKYQNDIKYEDDADIIDLINTILNHSRNLSIYNIHNVNNTNIINRFMSSIEQKLLNFNKYSVSDLMNGRQRVLIFEILKHLEM